MSFVLLSSSSSPHHFRSHMMFPTLPVYSISNCSSRVKLVHVHGEHIIVHTADAVMPVGGVTSLSLAMAAIAKVIHADSTIVK